MPELNYHELILARIATVLRRNQIEDFHIVSMMATYLVDSIILASRNLTCTEMQAFLRFAQNGFTVGAVGDSNASCPICGAPSAARLSHILRCGAVWVFLDEQCTGLSWDFSHPDRWQFLFGSLVSESDGAAQLCLVWDILQAGIHAGRLGQDGLAGSLSRLRGLCCRPGFPGRAARSLLPAAPAVQIFPGVGEGGHAVGGGPSPPGI
jgi:hypothetical protein